MLSFDKVTQTKKLVLFCGSQCILCINPGCGKQDTWLQHSL